MPFNLLPQPLQTLDVSLLETLFDEMPDVAFFVKDRQGRYAKVNNSLVERHGLQSKLQVMGKRPCDISTGDFGRIPSQQDEWVLRSARPLHDHLEMQWHAPNQPCWCLTTKLPIIDKEGHVVGIVGISRDIRAPIKPQQIPATLVSVLDHFERHLEEPVTPTTLAKSTGMSAVRFSRLMKRFFGITPSQYIAKHRITAASVLLLETSRSVSDIALACGYYDHSAFTRAFRKFTGISPSAYRDAAHRSGQSS